MSTIDWSKWPARAATKNPDQDKAATEPSQPGSAIHIGPDGSRSEYFNIEEAYRCKTEYDCAMIKLDDLGVPREDEGGNAYSIVGRIGILWKRAAKAESDVETIKLRHGVNADE